MKPRNKGTPPGAAADKRLLALCAEFQACQDWIASREGSGAIDDEHPENALWVAAIARAHKLYRAIARIRAISLAGATAQAAALPYYTENETNSRLASNVAATLRVVVGSVALMGR